MSNFIEEVEADIAKGFAKVKAEYATIAPLIREGKTYAPEVLAFVPRIEALINGGGLAAVEGVVSGLEAFLAAPVPSATAETPATLAAPAAPVLTSISQMGVNAGNYETPLIITVEGSEFDLDSVVHFDAEPGTYVLVTSYVSDTVLTASIPVDKLTTPQAYNVYVTQSSGTSNTLLFSVLG